MKGTKDILKLVTAMLIVINLLCSFSYLPAYSKVSAAKPKVVQSKKVVQNNSFDTSCFYALSNNWTRLFKASYPNTTAGNTNKVNKLDLGWYVLKSDGTLSNNTPNQWQRPNGYQTLLKDCSKYKIKYNIAIQALDTKTDWLTNIISNDKLADKTVTNIVYEANTYKSLNLSGVNLDFEYLGYSEKGAKLTALRNKFTNFCKSLSTKLKKNNLQLTLTLHPLNSYYKAYDYSSLGKFVDKIIIMAYDYGPKPEPEKKVTEAVIMAKKLVPSQKLILGISANNENSQSIVKKINIAKSYGLSGISIWYLGIISDSMWKSMPDVKH